MKKKLNNRINMKLRILITIVGLLIFNITFGTKSRKNIQNMLKKLGAFTNQKIIKNQQTSIKKHLTK